jgi:hypothetical protein
MLPCSRHRDNTMRGGLATSAVGLHLARRLAEDTTRGDLTTPASLLRVANPFNRSPSRRWTVLRCFQEPHQNSRAAPAGRQHLVAPPAQIASAVMPSCQVVVCAIFRRCTAPESPSEAEQPAAVYCKPSRPTMSLLQAPSSDAVPHRTGSCQATPAAAVRHE